MSPRPGFTIPSAGMSATLEKPHRLAEIIFQSMFICFPRQFVSIWWRKTLIEVNHVLPGCLHIYIHIYYVCVCVPIVLVAVLSLIWFASLPQLLDCNTVPLAPPPFRKLKWIICHKKAANPWACLSLPYFISFLSFFFCYMYFFVVSGPTLCTASCLPPPFPAWLCINVNRFPSRDLANIFAKLKSKANKCNIPTPIATPVYMNAPDLDSDISSKIRDCWLEIFVWLWFSTWCELPCLNIHFLYRNILWPNGNLFNYNIFYSSLYIYVCF